MIIDKIDGTANAAQTPARRQTMTNDAPMLRSADLCFAVITARPIYALL